MIKFYQLVLTIIFILSLISYYSNCTGDNMTLQEFVSKISNSIGTYTKNNNV